MHGRVGLLAAAIFAAVQVIGCGSSGGAGSGEVPGSRMSLAAAESGCFAVCATCKPGVACPDICHLECPHGVSPCGPTVCRRYEVCCNESCGICTRSGDTCSQDVCPPVTPCVDTVLCIRGFHWSPEECQCVPDEPCVDTVLCILGFHWSPTQCECVPNGSCNVDEDCRVFSDYCTGCDCRALSNEDQDPVCSGPGVECLADPCMGRTAQCVNGQCAVNPQCVQTQLCVLGSHWSPEQCACVSDHSPHPLHRPHPPHMPHPPHGPHVPGHTTSVEQACMNSGGVVSTATCCGSTGDFPNTCNIGACGCGPSASHEVRVCECGAGTCFDGSTCVAN